MSLRFSELMSVMTVSSPAFGLSWDSVGLVVGLLVIFLLAGKELVRAYGGRRTGTWMRLSNFAIVPLLLLLGVAILERVLPVLTGS